MEGETSDNVHGSDANNGEQIENLRFHKVCVLFSPLQSRWSFCQEVLLWQKLEISVVCFNLINVLFW